MMTATSKRAAPTESTSTATAPAPETSELTVLTWNIDGIEDISDDRTLNRFQFALNIIASLDVDVVCLQEMTPLLLQSLSSFAQMQNARLILPPAKTMGFYFVAMLVTERCHVLKQNHESFPGSKMGRSFLSAEVQRGDSRCTVFTSHLESLANFSAERVSQASIVLRRFPSCQGAAMFVGDLNMRDKEQLQLPLGQPDSVHAFDAWIALGSNRSNAYTWDLQTNSNKHDSMDGRPRCRFDRIYCSAASDVRQGIKPLELSLVGTEKMDEGYFPSDHYGLLFKFAVVSGNSVPNGVANQSKRPKVKA